MKTLKREDLAPICMTTGGEKKYPLVILEGQVYRWIGFGWVNEGKPTAKQLRELPQVQA